MCSAVSPQPWRSFLWRRGLRWMFSTQAALATCSAAEMVMVNPSESIKIILTHSNHHFDWINHYGHLKNECSKYIGCPTQNVLGFEWGKRSQNGVGIVLFACIMSAIC